MNHKGLNNGWVFLNPTYKIVNSFGMSCQSMSWFVAVSQYVEKSSGSEGVQLVVNDINKFCDGYWGSDRSTKGVENYP